MFHKILLSHDDHSVRCRAVIIAGILASALIGAVANEFRKSASIEQPQPWTSELKYATDSDPLNGGLVVDESNLNLGDVGESDRFIWQFSLHNPTNNVIVVDDFQGRCSQHVLTRSFTVPSGGNFTVEVELNLTPRDGRILDSVREIASVVVPIIEGAIQRGWILRGRSHRAFAYGHNSSFVEWGKISDPASPGEQAIELRALRQGVFVDAQCNPEHGTLNVIRMERGADVDFSIGFTPLPPAKGTKFSYPITISGVINGMTATHTWYAVGEF